VSAPAAVIFDNDGLTLDTEGLWTLAEKRLFERYETEFTPTHKLELLGKSGELAGLFLSEQLGLPASAGLRLVGEMDELVFEAIEEGVEPMPGAVELLAALEEAGIPRALCSNSPRPFVERATARAGVAGSFLAMVTGDDVERGKPAPDPYLETARLLGVDPAACVALEDSPPGAMSAHRAGMTVLVVPSFEGLDFEGADDARFGSLAEPGLWERLGLQPA
jgi:HAD superfamily hydrolase (TIGR01509 family)